jgi:site-specific DNA-cytosine methylase
MKKLKCLELFAGTRSVSKAFEAAGHEVFSVEWDKNFEDIDLYADILTVTADQIIEKFGKPDVIWASPDCTTFSIAAISHHRRKNPETGNLDPVSEYAKFCDKVDQHVLDLIRDLKPKFYFIENPRGGMRKMEWMQGLPRHTVTYCQYELDKPVSERRKKPTDIWTNHPDPEFKPMCKNGDPCHAAAPRGSKTGTQGLKGSKERSVIPRMLCEHIVYICEKAVASSEHS